MKKCCHELVLVRCLKKPCCALSDSGRPTESRDDRWGNPDGRSIYRCMLTAESTAPPPKTLESGAGGNCAARQHHDCVNTFENRCSLVGLSLPCCRVSDNEPDVEAGIMLLSALGSRFIVFCPAVRPMSPGERGPRLQPWRFPIFQTCYNPQSLE